MRRNYLIESICSVWLLSVSPLLSAQDLGGFDCLIQPHMIADVSTREEGVVAEFMVDRGDLVEQGQILVKLDSEVEDAAVKLAEGRTRLQAEIDEKTAHMNYTRKHFQRIDGLYKNKGTTLHDRDEAANDALLAKLILSQAKHREELAKLELARAEALLKRRTILSPIVGVVLQRMLSPGETVNDRPIIRVAQINVLNVEVIIPVEYFGSVDVGMQAKVMPKYPGAKEELATVTVVDSVLDAASDTFGVRLELQNTALRIPAGVRCEISFES